MHPGGAAYALAAEPYGHCAPCGNRKEEAAMAAISRDEKIIPINQDHHALEKAFTEIRTVDIEAPWRWIAAGWADMTRMMPISLAYGAAFTAIAIALLFGLTRIGLESVILALAGGFLLVGPILAVGLYEGSRRLEGGEPVRARDILLAGFRAPGQLALLGLALLMIYVVWMQTAFLLFMVFLGTQPFPPMEDFISSLLLTTRGVTLLTVGTIEGAALAILVFMICAVSAPMLMDRRVGAVEAIVTSVRAVRFNLKPMALWAVLIAAFMALGLATLFAGLVVAFPLIGHATWHAYRDIVGAERATLPV
jgi:uncharacterized membrane protein